MREGRERIRAVIVDDEPAAREAVRTFLAGTPEVEIAGEASSGREAIELVRRIGPDLLFLDVQMPDLDGFMVLEALGADMPPGVVLVTAHGQYARRAFDVHAIDYVTKPFGRRRFMAAVERALHRLAADEALHARTTLESLVRSMKIDQSADVKRESIAEISSIDERVHADEEPGRIGVRLGSRITLVSVADIDWIEADGELVRLHVGDDTHLLKSRMQDLEARFGPHGFARIHRSAIVNLDRARVLEREPDGSGTVGLASGVRLRVARSRWEDLERALGLATG